MNDRFKFRFFHNNTIYDVFAVDFMNKTALLVSLDRKETLFKGIDTDKLIQCTGLKDKDNKLIYEGDIVKDLCIDCLCTVVWKKAEFGLKSQYSSYIGFNTPEQEVIGNIYENKELLEA